MDAGPPSAPEPGQAVDVARQARDAEEYEFTGDWFSHNISVWERIFSARAWLDSSNKAVHVLEVGSWEGRSAVWLLTRVCGHGASTLTAIDCWRGAALYGSNAQRFGLDAVRHSSEAVEARFERNVAASGAGHKVTKLKDTSLRALARLVAGAGKLFDVIYVDGSHKARDVIADAVLAWALLRPGGILIFDDYKYEHIVRLPAGDYPRNAIDAFVKLFEQELFVLHVGYQFIVEKCDANTGHTAHQ